MRRNYSLHKGEGFEAINSFYDKNSISRNTTHHQSYNLQAMLTDSGITDWSQRSESPPGKLIAKPGLIIWF